MLYAFFLEAAAALAAFFLLLRTITMPMKEPTTVDPRMTRRTGMRMAQTRGGKRVWRMWSSSTKGWEGDVSGVVQCTRGLGREVDAL